MGTFPPRPLGRPFQFLGRVKVGKSLRQIDGPVRVRQPGHLPDDGLTEEAYSLTR